MGTYTSVNTYTSLNASVSTHIGESNTYYVLICASHTSSVHNCVSCTSYVEFYGYVNRYIKYLLRIHLWIHIETSYIHIYRYIYIHIYTYIDTSLCMRGFPLSSQINHRTQVSIVWGAQFFFYIFFFFEIPPL